MRIVGRLFVASPLSSSILLVMKYLIISLAILASCSIEAQNTRFVHVGKQVNTPQQDWTLNTIYAKPFFTVFTWSILCKDMTSTVYLPESIYIEDNDTHIRYGLAKKPIAVNPTTFNQNIKYEIIFKGLPNSVHSIKLVTPLFTINDIALDNSNGNKSDSQIQITTYNSNKDKYNINEEDIKSEIDRNIPENKKENKNCFVVIFSNENYHDVEKVPYASHDGEIFKQYCEKTLGIPLSNIRLVPDATLNNIKRQVSWLTQVMEAYNGEANVIFYYAGHGIPDESNRSAYLLPIDGVGNDVSTGYSLEKLYTELSSKPAKSVVVLLDACFSGAMRDGGMIASARGVAIKAKQEAPKGNMVVISAAQGDETAYPYKEKGHGMFTYYLLKKLQDSKGNCSLGELADYVTSEVKKQSVVINGKMQTPAAIASGGASNWKSWKLR